MSKVLSIHPENPQSRLIKEVIELWKKVELLLIQLTQVCFRCALGNKNAMDQIINIRKLRKHHHFTLMMKDLSHIGEYAKLNNSGFRLLKKILPGAYTFILEGTKDIPNRLLNGKRKTIGIRVSSHPVVQSILENLMEPMMSVSLKIEGYEFYNSNDVKEVLNGSNDLIIDSGHCPPEPTTIIDLSNDEVLVLRNGNGSLELVT